MTTSPEAQSEAVARAARERSEQERETIWTEPGPAGLNVHRYR